MLAGGGQWCSSADMLLSTALSPARVTAVRRSILLIADPILPSSRGTVSEQCSRFAKRAGLLAAGGLIV